MNRFLASSLSALNGIIAIIIMVVSAFGGFYGAAGSPIGLVLGAAAGFLIATLVCGLIAYLALIEQHLAKIAREGSTATSANAAPH